MAANPTLHEDLALFRRLLQVINVVQKEDTHGQCGAPTSSKDYQPVFNSGVKRRRSEVDFQEEAMTEGSESDDDEEEDGGDDEDDDDDEIQDIDTEEEDTEEDEEEDYEEEDYDEEEVLHSDNEDDSSSSESDTLYDKHDDEPTLQFNPPSSPSPSICPPKTPSSHHPTPLQTQPFPSTKSSSPRNNPNLSPPLNPTTPPQNTTPPPRPKAQNQTSNDLRCYDHDCNGRLFATRSNLQRHRREKSHARLQFRCPRCGAVFSRTTARNTHVASGSCHRIRRYSNGRVRKGERVRDD